MIHELIDVELYLERFFVVLLLFENIYLQTFNVNAEEFRLE